MNVLVKTVLVNALIALVLLSTNAGAQTVTYLHTDVLGSVVAESDAGGNIATRVAYEPYGEVIGGSVADGPGYTGHVRDATTGLSYMQQRYMDPQLGLFLSVDAVTAYQQPIGQFNRYRYANGNPYRFTDPDGGQSREFNWENRRLGIVPPPRAKEDWLGPAIGISLAVVSAPAVAYGGFELGMLALANPATTNSVGLAAAEIFMGDALGGSSLRRTVPLYRAVENPELASLNKLGHFTGSPNGDTVKRFVGTRDEAELLAASYSKAYQVPYTVVEGAAPGGVMNAASRTPFSDVPGRPMQAIGIPSDQVHRVSCIGSHIKQKSC